MRLAFGVGEVRPTGCWVLGVSVYWVIFVHVGHIGVKHMRKDVFGVFQSLNHFEVGGLHG